MDVEQVSAANVSTPAVEQLPSIQDDYISLGKVRDEEAANTSAEVCSCAISEETHEGCLSDVDATTHLEANGDVVMMPYDDDVGMSQPLRGGDCPGGDKTPLRVLTANIDTNLGNYHGKICCVTHPGFATVDRMPRILRAFTESMADVILVQECRKCTFTQADGRKVDIDSLTPVVNHLEALGYTAVVTKYAPDDMAFSYVTAFKADRFTAVGETETPFITADGTFMEDRSDFDRLKTHNFGESFARCIAITRVVDVQHRDEELLLVNVHLGLGEQCRMAASDIAPREIAARMPTNGPVTRVVAAGDFNSIADMGGHKQLQLLDEACDGADISRLPLDGRCTFIPFPYDLCEASAGFAPRWPELAKAINSGEMTPEEGAGIINEHYSTITFDGKILDHMLVRGFTSQRGLVPLTPVLKTPREVLALGAPHAPSDHIFLSAELVYQELPHSVV